jgi:hypothetical protein
MRHALLSLATALFLFTPARGADTPNLVIIFADDRDYSE